MDWGRIKGLLIVLLAISNVIAGAMYLNMRNSKYYLPESTVEAVEKNLSSRGIEISENAINLEKPDDPVYIGNVADNEGMRGELEELAELFVGESTEEPSFMTAPEGVSISLVNGGRTALLSVTGNMYFTGYTSDTENFASVSELEEICAKRVVSHDAVSVTPEQKRIISRFYEIPSNAENVNKTVPLGYECVGNIPFKAGSLVSVIQKIAGIGVPELTATFAFDAEDRLMYAGGAIFFGKAERAYSEKLLDGVTALYKLDISDISKILGESFAYTPIRIEEGKYYFVPGWAIEVITANDAHRLIVSEGISGEQKNSYDVLDEAN